MDEPQVERNQEQSSVEHVSLLPPKPRRKIFGAVAAIAVFALVLIGIGIAHHKPVEAGDGDASPPPASAATDFIETTPDQQKQIRVEEVHEQLLDLDLEVTAKVGFNEDRLTPVFAPYGGRVMELLANKGDLVQSGQPLLVVESGDFVTAVNDLVGARSDVDKAKLEVEAAAKAEQRARSLNALEALATKELQAAESDLARAREDQRRAESALSVVRNRLALFGKSEDDVRGLEQSVNDQIDRRIVIRAPLAGTVVDRKVGPGQYVKSDTPDPLYLISDLSSVWVSADVYETHLPNIRVGAPVEIRVPAYPDTVFHAQVAAINPTVDPTTRTVHVRCSVVNKGGLLKPEMFASIRIGGSSKRKVPIVPSTAVLTQGTESFVLVEDSAGKFRRLQVKPGREIKGYTVVEDGLPEGSRVVTAGVLLLYNGLGK